MLGMVRLFIACIDPWLRDWTVDDNGSMVILRLG